MMSIDIAVIDINNAISTMNSRNGSGNRAAVASAMSVSGELTRAYVTVAAAQAAPNGAARQCVM
jgi:hypothetical protein